MELLRAVYFEQVAEVERLLSDKTMAAQMGINHELASGGTLLHLATHRGNRLMVLVLMDRGSSVHVLDRCQETPLHIAARMGRTDIVRILVRRLSISDSSINTPNVYGNTALHLAANEGHEETVRFLVSWGADLGAINSDFETPMDCALQSNHTFLAQELIRLFNLKELDRIFDRANG